MRLKLTMRMDNAAFDDGYWANEAARILRAAANRVEDGDTDFDLIDWNGNQVGKVEIEPRAKA